MSLSEALLTTALLLAPASEELAQGPYVVTTVRFEPATLFVQDTELTTLFAMF